MAAHDITVTLSAVQDSVLGKLATKLNTTVDALLIGVAEDFARSQLAQYERELLASVPSVWPKATAQEKAQLAAKLEEIDAR